MDNHQLTFRLAALKDVPAIVAIMADDVLGKTREDASLPLAECYIQAFEQISSDSK